MKGIEILRQSYVWNNSFALAINDPRNFLYVKFEGIFIEILLNRPNNTCNTHKKQLKIGKIKNFIAAVTMK